MKLLAIWFKAWKKALLGFLKSIAKGGCGDRFTVMDNKSMQTY